MGVSDSVVATSLVEAARALGPCIRAGADEAERERRLPRPLVEALAEAGLFKMLVPRAFGGGEVEPATCLRAIEEVARADGSAGWCVMVGAASAMIAGYLPPDLAETIFGRDPHAYLAFVVRPSERALPVDGGYRVSGRWGFASGCHHATWFVGASLVHDGDAPRRGADGTPELRWLLFPAAECRIVDTWRATGLCGTGSHDVTVTDVFVPLARSLVPPAPAPRQPGPLYAFGLGAVVTAIAAVALGIARGAVDAFVELAEVKAVGTGRLRDQPSVQDQVGQAEGRLRAARAALYATVGEVWAGVLAAGPTTPAQQHLLNLASAHATTASAEVVDLMWSAAGSSSIVAGHPIERRFRDIHVVTQHNAVGPAVVGAAGRMFLGLDETAPPPGR